MWMSTSKKLPNVLKWLLVRKLSLLENAWKLLSLLQPAWLICDANSGRRTTAVLPIAKIQSACLFPLKMPSLKNPDPGSLCKKWGVRVRHVDCNHFLAKKTFFATTRVVPFFSGNSKGDIPSSFSGEAVSLCQEAVWNGKDSLRVSWDAIQRSCAGKRKRGRGGRAGPRKVC